MSIRKKRLLRPNPNSRRMPLLTALCFQSMLMALQRPNPTVSQPFLTAKVRRKMKLTKNVEEDSKKEVEDKEKVVSSQKEEQTTRQSEHTENEAVDEPTAEEQDAELTEEEIRAIDNPDITDDIKNFAIAYLNGERNTVTELSYKTLKDYVRNISRSSARNSTDADTAQLGK